MIANASGPLFQWLSGSSRAEPRLLAKFQHCSAYKPECIMMITVTYWSRDSVTVTVDLPNVRIGSTVVHWVLSRILS